VVMKVGNGKLPFLDIPRWFLDGGLPRPGKQRKISHVPRMENSSQLLTNRAATFNSESRPSKTRPDCREAKRGEENSEHARDRERKDIESALTIFRGKKDKQNGGHYDPPQKLETFQLRSGTGNRRHGGREQRVLGERVCTSGPGRKNLHGEIGGGKKRT